MLRNTLESLGSLFSNKITDVAMGIISAFFVVPKIQSLDEISITDPQFILTALIVTVLSAVVFQIIGVAFSWISETIPVNILIEIPEKPEIIETWSSNELTSRNICCVQITNKEHVELSDCYAVINVEKPDSQLYKYLTDVGEKKLSWKNPLETPCKSKIGANYRSEILYVYEIKASRKVDSNSIAMSYSDFCYCDQKKSVINLTPTKVIHEFSIVIHGKLNNKDVKSAKKYFRIEIDGLTASINFNRKGFIKLAAT